MFAALSRHALDAILRVYALYSRILSRLPSRSNLLLCGLVIWIFFNLVQEFIVNFWYNLNFKEPWTSSDYPPLCSASTFRLLPWKSSEYPVLSSPAGNIRLLQIHPSRDMWGIEATLESRSFLERPQYKALSYTWGDPQKVKPITVNGKKMNVTENLWNALFYLRDSHRPQTLWVDAICIDQSNIEEKNVQIPLMSFIYSRAQEVVVWLGNHKGPRWIEQSTLSSWHGNWATSKATDDWAVSKYWLYLLTNEEYWRRCWVVQEIAMASRIRVVSGRSGLPWHDFLQMVKLYKERVPQAHNIVDKVLTLESLRQARYVDGHSYSLSQLLEQFSDCFCSVNLDKILAFAGMASDCLEGCIDFDYSKSPFAIYQELLAYRSRRSLVLQDDAIETLRFAGLVRTILARRSIVTPKLLNPPGVGESANSLLYLLCSADRAEFCGLIPSLRSLLSWVDVVHRLFNRLTSYLSIHKTDDTALWLPSRPELSRTWLSPKPHNPPTSVRVRGIITARVCQLGPSYREFIESSSAQRRWSSHLSSIWGLACNMTRMRSAKAMNDRLTMLLGAAADYRMRNFVNLDEGTPYSFYSSRLFIAFGTEDSQREVVMGLAPWETLPGDLIVQFWKSDAALVVRDSEKNGERVQIGRAGVVKDSGAMDWEAPSDKQLFESSESAVEFFASVDMITRLSFDTVCLPGTRGLRFDESLWDQTRQLWTSHDFEMKEAEPLKDGMGYDNCWEHDRMEHIDETAAWEHDRMEHIDETAARDLEAACMTRPCLRYTSPNIKELSYGVSYRSASHLI
jgi:hypothetical protein